MPQELPAPAKYGTFGLWVPAAALQDLPGGTFINYKNMGLNKMERLLIVDDDVIYRMVLKTFLTQHFDIDESPSAEDASILIESTNYSLVITDNNMEEITGIQLIEQFNKKVPCILMSSENAEKEAYKAGAVYFFNKKQTPTLLSKKALEITNK